MVIWICSLLSEIDGYACMGVNFKREIAKAVEIFDQVNVLLE